MLKIVGIIVAAVLAVVVVTNLVGDDETGVEVDQQAEAPVAEETVTEEPADEAPAEDVAVEEAEAPVVEEPVMDEAPAEDAVAAETTETEPDTAETPVEGKPVVEPGAEALADNVEETAEDAAGTEAAGSVEGLEALKEVLNASEFDFGAVQEAIASSDLDDDRKDQLTTALERAAPYASLREAVLEDIRAELIGE